MFALSQTSQASEERVYQPTNKMNLPAPVDYVGILGTIVAAQILGFLWYGPLFGKLWVKEMALDVKNMKVTATPFIVSMIANVVLSFVIGNVYALLKVTVLQHAMWIASALWAVNIALRIPHYAFGQKSFLLFLIDSSYDLVIICSAASIMFYRL